ncbi:MAG TPA: undecaprenyl-diphosphatase UppP [Anaerolineales bacterium]|nr:undecaprenyl-diphosphatase UppP [Anaerolineales bacterium]
MSFIQAIILGIVQGLTEFLPISSTAHLILIPWLFGWSFDPQAAFVFDVLVQLGTLAAVIVYFAKDIWQIALAVIDGLRRRKPFESGGARLGWLVVVATAPATVIGLLFKGYFEVLHRQPVIVAAIVFSAAGLIFVVEYAGRRNRSLASLSWIGALMIGCSQALALLPGVSRSAATLSGGLALGLERPAAARFSFLMSIPIMLAAGAIAVKDLVELPNFITYLPPLALGFFAAAVVGFVSIHWLLGYLATRSMNIFAWYRLGFGLLCLVIALVRR